MARLRVRHGWRMDRKWVVIVMITTLRSVSFAVQGTNTESTQNPLQPVDESAIFTADPLPISSQDFDLKQCSNDPGKEFHGTLGEVHGKVNPVSPQTPSTQSSEGVDEESSTALECHWTVTAPDRLFVSILVDVLQPCKTDAFTLSWPDERDRDKLRTVNCDSRSVVALTSTNKLQLRWTDRYGSVSDGKTRFKLRFQATEKSLFNKLRVVFTTELSGFISPVGYDGQRLVRVNAETVYQLDIPENYVVMMSFEQRQLSLSGMTVNKGIFRPIGQYVRISEQLALDVLLFGTASATHSSETVNWTVGAFDTTAPSAKLSGGRKTPSTQFSGGRSLINWIGNSSNVEPSYNGNIVLIKVNQSHMTLTYKGESKTFLTEADGCFYVGFKLRFSFHRADETPEYIIENGKTKFNCSVPHYENFKQHVRCNLEQECQGGEDEGEHCPYSPSGCQGDVGYNNKCFYILPEPKRFISFRGNDIYCQETGGHLAEFKTKSEWNAFLNIFKFGKTSYNYVISALRMATDRHVDMDYYYYFEQVYWLAKGVSYDLDFNLYRTYHYGEEAWIFYSPEWSPILSAWRVLMRQPVYMACQREAGKDQSASKSAPPLPVPENVTYFSRAANLSLNSSFVDPNPLEAGQLPAGWDRRNYLASCPAGHVTRDFLSCDPRSQCGTTAFEPVCPLLKYENGEASSELVVPMYVCSDGKTVHYTLVCDTYEDCDSDDDRKDCDILSRSSTYPPFEMGERIRIYRLPPPAIVDFRYNAGIVQKRLEDSHPCPETHLQCPGESNYCLPVYVRCNSYADCAGGEDEVDCENYHCPGFYRCRSSHVCLHVDHLCDGLAQCPLRDDELLCDVACPKGCQCQGLVYICHLPVHPDAPFHRELRYLDAAGSGIQPERLGSVRLIWLSLAFCDIETAPFVHLPILRTFDLSNNKIRSFNMTAVHFYPRLRVLLLRGNPLVVLEPSLTLSGGLSEMGLNEVNEKHELLVNLDLSYTRIQLLDTTSLGVCSSLHSLNLSFSEVSKISDVGFTPVQSLQVIDIRENPVSQFPAALFQILGNLRMLYTTNFELCCPDLLPASFDTRNCFSTQLDISSCENLLMTEYRVFLWIIGVLAIVGNAGSFIYRVLVQRKTVKSGFSVFVSSLCVADFLMGVYLVIVGTADDLYKGKYYLYKNTWTASEACKVAGFLCLVSSEVSAFIISLITLDRFVVLRFPFSTLHFKRWSAIVACGAAWGLGALFAGVPLLPGLAHWDFYGQTGLCIPLPVTRKSFRGRDYSFSIMVVLNFMLFVLIAVGQACIYWSVRQNSMAADSTKASQDLTIARRLIAVALSDFFCWFPIGLLGLLARKEGAVSSQFTIFTAVFALPLNSALNPFLYTYNVVQERRRKQAEARLLAHAKSLVTSSSRESKSSTGNSA